MSEFATHPVIRALGWALFHSLWQGTLIALLAAGFLYAARGRSPEFRYRLAAAALALMVLTCAGTMLWLLPLQEAEVFPAGGLLAPVFDTGLVAGGWLRFKHAATPWLPYLILAWSLGVSLRFLKLGAGLVWLYGSCLRATKPAPTAWENRFEQLRARAGISATVRLRLSRQVDSLLVLGWLKPIVLVLAGALLALSPEALEALLIHELAHIRRGDFLANLLQALVESIFFYHPAVGWLSRRMRQEREHCCDDAAVRACGDPILYASALVGLEELRRQPSLLPDLAPAASGGNLMSRIQRLLLPKATLGAPAPLALLVPTFLLAATLGAATLAPSRFDLPPSTSAPAVDDAVDFEFTKIRVKHQPEAPAYPAEAKAQRIQGIVVVLMVIDRQGQVLSAKAVSGPEELHACAVGYAKGWVFEPAKVNGKAVPARFKLTMPFRLR